MHLLARETTWLDEADGAVDTGQTPADLVFLSFSDSDLGAAAAASERRFGLRLADLKRLRHPMSVDLYLDQVVAGARFVAARLLGGLEYWRYGAEELAAYCRRAGIALALLPGDAREDARLAALSTLPTQMLARLDALLRAGGPENLARFLRLAAACAGLAEDPAEAPVAIPPCGVHRAADPADARPLAVVVFYRAHLVAGDVAPIEALLAALDAQGLAAEAWFVASLKAPECAAFVARRLAARMPAVVLNATGFSAREADRESPLAAAGPPVLQMVLSGAARSAWEASARGLSQTDLAMQVVLPELDGTLLAGVVSFKEPAVADPALQYARVMHAPFAPGIAAVTARAAAWARLTSRPRGARRIAVVLSDYPGAQADAPPAIHAVGLDVPASLAALLRDLQAAGYDLGGAALPDAAALVAALCAASPAPFLDLAAYRSLAAALPASLRDAVDAAWGAPEDDPACVDGAFRLRHLRLGAVVVAVQPDRGRMAERRAGYHDPDRAPRHLYVAFYLWLRAVFACDAMVHLGTHGTLEWLPGKATALSPGCAPLALIGGLPVLYPFIVNNPGEAAAAKRRLGAVALGHLTPPLMRAGLSGEAREVERLIEEYAAADGLDARRTATLRQAILERAAGAGLLAESGVAAGGGQADALARLDAYLCDVKDMQIRDGLHVFGRAPSPAQREALLAGLRRAAPAADPALLAARLDACAAAERLALLAALDGRFVPPGPAGAPTRGRIDVLPTGRNLTAADPRAIPQPSAVALAERQAAALLRRHLQDHGEYPRRLVIDLWGSATLRTGGEDFALALVLLGARPVWEPGSGRVTGVEIVPLAVLDRPRIDVALRISGLFRDAFPAQIALYAQAVRAIAARDEAAEDNPLVAAREAARIWGPAPGCYGAGADAAIAADRAVLGEAYLAAGGHHYGIGAEGAADRAGFAAWLAGADALVHAQDHAETDLLDGGEHAAHVGGFAAAAAMLGASPALWHLDTSAPDAARVRSAAEEIARVVRGRAANPRWLAGMMRHGHAGAVEIARAVDALAGFAAALPTRLDAQFDLLFDATLGDTTVDAFLRAEAPAIRAAMTARFAAAREAGLWHPRRNAVAGALEAAS